MVMSRPPGTPRLIRRWLRRSPCASRRHFADPNAPIKPRSVFWILVHNPDRGVVFGIDRRSRQVTPSASVVRSVARTKHAAGTNVLFGVIVGAEPRLGIDCRT